MGQPTFSKGEKKKCKYYNFGKCKIQAHGKDCQPHTKDGAIPEYIEGCSAFETRIVGNNLEETRNAEKLQKETEKEEN